MAISITRYVDITSGVGGATLVDRRELIGRLFTENNLLPPNTYVEFTTLEEVGELFGTTSEEYYRAEFYFGWISKDLTRAQKISYFRWVSTAVAPRIYGSTDVTQALATYTAISNGSFGVTIGSTVNTFTAVDFSGATNLADVAAILQVAIRTKTGTMWTAATVTYNASRGTFDFVGGDAVAGAISVQEGSGGTPVAATLGWRPQGTFSAGVYSNGAIWASGSALETVTDALDNSNEASDNYGSFLFIPSQSLSEVTEAAEWNLALNVKYMYTVPVLAADRSTWSAALDEIGGVGLTFSPVVSPVEYPEQVPMMIMAATDYDAINSVQNYEFQQFDLTPSVTNDSDATTYDDLRINYYGQTQTAGQLLSFYQKGVLMGLVTDPVDMNVYANEVWLKAELTATFMNLLLSLSKISANNRGQIQLMAVMQDVINLALNNGTISPGKALTTTQKLYIKEVTGDPNASYQVQTIGYWFNVAILQNQDTLEYYARPTLVYSKDDDIRAVIGQDVLI